MNINLAFFSVIILLSISSCVEPIDFEIERGKEDSLVIDGRIVEHLDAEVNYAEVRIQRVFNFESSSRSTVSVDEVIISNGVQTIELEQVGLGLYGKEFINEAFTLDQELSYSLYVKALDGREFQSKKVLKPKVPNPEALYADIVPTRIVDSLGQATVEDQALIYINTPVLSQDDNALLWEASHTYQVSTTQVRKCYVTEDLLNDKIIQLDTRDLTINRLDDYQLFRVPVSKKYREGVYLTVEQYSLDAGISKQLRDINTLITQANTTFNTPLNKLGSNISNINDLDEDVFGFFYATQRKDIRVKLDSIRTYCTFQGTEGEPDCALDFFTRKPVVGADPLCCDCRKVPGSVIVKPDYWE